MVRAPHERTKGKADPSRSPAAGRKQPSASGHSMNEELHWQPMASQGPGPGATTAPADLRRPRAIRESTPPGPQAQTRMALGVKGGGMLGQWYTLSPPPPVGEMPKTRLTRSEGPPTPSPG